MPEFDPKFVADLHARLDATLAGATNGAVQVINATRTVNDYSAGYRRLELTGAIAMLVLPGDKDQQRRDLTYLRDEITRLLGEDGERAMAREDERQGRR